MTISQSTINRIASKIARAEAIEYNFLASIGYRPRAMQLSSFSVTDLNNAYYNVFGYNDPQLSKVLLKGV